jgi:hypothetical protein
MPRKVLSAGGNAVVLERRDDRDAQASDHLRILCKGAVANDRVVGVRVDIEHGRVVERNADGAQFARERCGKPGGEATIAASAQDGHWRPFRERRLQPRDAAPLLVHAHP